MKVGFLYKSVENEPSSLLTRTSKNEIRLFFSSSQVNFNVSMLTIQIIKKYFDMRLAPEQKETIICIMLKIESCSGLNSSGQYRN